MRETRLELTRRQVLGHRLRASFLDRRLPMSAESLRRASWAGHQDSVPRSALLSIHARVAGTRPDALDDPSLVQLWGPRFSAYVVAAADRAFFSLGRLSVDPVKRQLEETVADRLEAFLAGRKMPYGEAGHALGVNPNMLRYAAPTGRVLIRWDGAASPTVWAVPRPEIDPLEARLELARRYLHVLGPGTPEGFSRWAGVRPVPAAGAFSALAGSLAGVRTPLGEGWILAVDEAGFRAPEGEGVAGGEGLRAGVTPHVRLLPSGDVYFLFHGNGPERDLLVPDPALRAALWTPRVWPGALLLDGEIAGTWRRSAEVVAVEPWRRLSASEREAVEAEARTLPLPGVRGPILVSFAD